VAIAAQSPMFVADQAPLGGLISVMTWEPDRKDALTLGVCSIPQRLLHYNVVIYIHNLYYYSYYNL
jgi:hypothetical protein